MANRIRNNLYNLFFPAGGDKNDPTNEPPPSPSPALQSPFTEVFSLESHTNTVRYLCLVRDMMVSCGDDGVLTLWNTETCTRVCSTETHHLGVSCLYQPAYWHTRLTDSFILTASPQLISLWQVEQDRIEHLKDFTGHSGTVRCLNIIEHGVDGVLCAAGTNVTLWERNGRLLKELPRPCESSYLHHTIVQNAPGQSRLISASSHPLIEAYSIDDNCIEFIPPPADWDLYRTKHMRENITDLVEVSKAVFATGSKDGSIILWSMELLPIIVFNFLRDYCIESYEEISITIKGGPDTKQKLVSRSFPHAVRCFAVIHQRYVVSGVGRAIKIFDTTVTKEDPVVTVKNAHKANVTCLALISEDTVLASGAEDGSIRIWIGSDRGSPPLSLTAVKPLLQCLTANHHLILIGEVLLHSQQVNAICDLCPLGFASCADNQIYLYKDSGYVENTEYNAIRKLLTNSKHPQLRSFFSQLNQGNTS